MRRSRTALATIILAVSTVAGCVHGGFTTIPTSTLTASGPAARATQEAGTLEDAATPTPTAARDDLPPQGTLRLWGQDPLTLDPARSADVLSHGYVLQIYSGLVRLDHDLEAVSDMATWQVNEAGTVYTFRLKDGVTFHDGRPVAADDVVYSLNRSLAPATRSATAADFLGDIVGAREVLSGRAKTASGIRALDTRTVEITIDQPKAYFLAKLAYPVAFVVDRAQAEKGEDWWRTPNGTGPFRLTEWTAKQVLTLERADGFYGHKASVRSVVYRLTSGAPIRLYETGEIDAAPVFLSDLDRVESRSPLKDELRHSPELSISYLGFDVTRAPFDDPRVRQAFLMAVDRERVIETVLDGRYTLAQGLLPPGIPGYAEDASPIPFDPQRAKRLIVESRYGSVEGLPAITLTEAGSVTSDALTDALIAEWRRNLGVEVNVRLIPDDRYVTDLKSVKGNLFTFGWVADYPDPQDFLAVLFRSDRENNAGGYSNPRFDDLVDRAATMRDTDERMRLYAEAERVLVADAGFIPLYHPVGYHLVKPDVHCYAPDAQGQVDLSRIRLSPGISPGLTPPCF